ncbi:tRNA 2-selenouridine(34) synthase MnmH [Paraburkholderia sp. LEh10]|uniref:tRNA 2-selenouridine(34) synthase MnmH n=1 Tax=Paraburkholderia sp. LEh10 TaxID=2821353 RepID=UPI001AE62446|nr:tRNA 2-selenouridine(34) synthase MnmH [Paraburkholderia sp. LEh10]MBP0589658.1 tRNA 2-selenouridine(34) synthase MnmH [Paraburkholderia sp. LEh10]
MKSLLVPLDQLADFDEIVDVRTPLEFAEDHIPGAINAPVLSNEERVIIGTMYKQVSPFEATRQGAAMVSRNIAAHLETTFADRPRNWRPLIYCWRGGKRSGSMTTWFNLIGWRARQLDGGYKSYRRGVVEALDALPRQFRYIVLAGHTGSGKTRLLNALAGADAQTLDLEALAAHRGSILGMLPHAPQPSQKAFDTALVSALRGFDTQQPVFVEAESRRIGSVSLPASLTQEIHRGTCVRVDTERGERIRLLLQDYAHLFDDREFFKSQLAKLVELHGYERIGEWQTMIDEDRRVELFEQLIDLHYDPAYARSTSKHFARLTGSMRFALRPNDADLHEQACALLEQFARASVV